jgi:two-component system sensor histidine kinase RegB
MQTIKYLSYLPIIRWGTLSIFFVITFGMNYFLPTHQILQASVFLVLLHATSNILLHLTFGKISQPFITPFAFFILGFDMLLLTLLISQNGGAHNPFSSIFLVFAGFSALLLSRYYFLIFIILSFACLSSIYWPSAEGLHHASHDPNYFLHLKGMWLANALGIILVCAWIYYMKNLNSRMFKKTEATQKILSHIEKVESLGRTVASASHQLNTPLGTLQLGLSELNDQTNPISEAERKRWHEDMQHAINQISNIISKIHSQSPEEIIASTEIVDSNDFITQWVGHWSSPRHQIVKLDLQSAGFEIKTQTAEALGNLISILLDNASEAGLSESVLIELKTYISKTDFYLSIKDNGCGMDADTKAHAFEPLFTTKTKGTGLGLYLCHQIVQKFQGEILIDSAPSQGTIITIRLNKNLL